MNILFVSDVSISKVIGGAERVLFEQSTRLAQRGHNVHVLTRMLPDHSRRKDVIQGVQEQRYDVDPSNHVSFICSSTRNCKSLYESLQIDGTFDIINFHQPFSALGVLRTPASRTIKKIYTCHSLSFEEYQSRNPRPRRLIQRAQYELNVQGRKRIEEKVLRSSDQIIVLSRYTLEKLLNIYGLSPDKTVLIPGGVDLERFRPAVHKMDIRRRLSIPQNKFILLTVRNLVSRMGLENFIHSLSEVAGALPGVHVIIGGEGPLKKSLQSLARELHIADIITFAGFIPEIDLPEYYRAADVFILPTLELEGFGLVTLEALASGLPVLGTPVGGTPEILQQLDEAYIFEDTSPGAMTKRIIDFGRQYLNNPDLLRDTSLRCRSFVEENYSWEKNVNLIEILFRTTCGS